MFFFWRKNEKGENWGGEGCAKFFFLRRRIEEGRGGEIRGSVKFKCAREVVGLMCAASEFFSLRSCGDVLWMMDILCRRSGDFYGEREI